ncbi:MAG: hypothetical protein JSW71_13650, partial [Gemmatimonadota bacterium]
HTKLLLVAVVLAVSVLIAAPAHAKLTGAIWTTLCDGSSVDHNVYAAKEDVYLNAGPTGVSGAWVPDGDYYFMVTDPPGKTLLSTDSIAQRKVQIEDGKVLEPGLGYTDHFYCEDVGRPGNYTIQLMPYDDSANGEYKLWITRVENYEPGNPASKFGFIPSESKTDNFRVRRGQVCIFGYKFEDLNGNGIWDMGEDGLPDWEIQLFAKKGNTLTLLATSLTSNDGSYAFCVSESGTYLIAEVLQAGWAQTAPPPPGTFTVNVNKSQLRAGEDKGPYNFGNYRPPQQATLAGVKYHDLNADGSLDPGEPGIEGWCVTITAGTFDNGDFIPDYTVTDTNDVLGPWTECTDPNGVWRKDDLRRGYVYQICEILEPGWTQTGPNDGALSIYVQAKDGCWYAEVPAQVPPGGDDTNYERLNFGNVSEDCGRIRVFKFEDYNANGVLDGIDRPLSNWYIFLYTSTGRIIEWGPTDENGEIEFPLDPDECLPLDCYIVFEMSIPSWVCATCTLGDWAQEVCIDETNPVAVVDFGNQFVGHEGEW